jgi:hypothetical protein
MMHDDLNGKRCAQRKRRYSTYQYTADYQKTKRIKVYFGGVFCLTRWLLSAKKFGKFTSLLQLNGVD